MMGINMRPNGVGSIGARAWSVALALMFILMAYPASAAGPAPVHESAEVQTLDRTGLAEGMFSGVRGDYLGRHIQKLQDFGTRYAFRGDKCYPASDYIASVFEANGLDTSFDYFPYQTHTMRNVIGVKHGTTRPDVTIIVCSHYDSYSSRAPYEAPGADDNGSGTAGVMAIAEALSDFEFNYTIKFIAFGAEEEWMIGSLHYVEEALASGENISAVVNLDMIAHNPDPATPQVYLYTGDAEGPYPSALISELVNTTVIHPEIGIQIVDGGYSPSDHLFFSQHYPAVMLLEYNFNPHYHRPTETIDKLNLTYCANVTQLALATVARMAGIASGDVAPPALSRNLPAAGGYAPAAPAISIEATDPTALNLTSIDLRVNGVPVTPSLSPVPMGYNITFTPPAPYPDGAIINVSFGVRDAAGNPATRAWAFTVDAVPPEPPTNFTLMPSRTELVKQGTALDIGTTYDYLNVLSPTVIHKDGEYKMWYTASSSSTFVIGFATSPNGVAWDSWTRQGVVIPKGAIGSPDGYGAAHPTVVFDGEYKMWYAGFDNVRWRIMYANSTDGLTWVKRGLAFGNASYGDADAVSATYPCVLMTDEYEMWYMGFDGVRYRYLYANSSDGVSWAKYPAGVSPEGTGCRYGDVYMGGLEVVWDGERYLMYYGRDNGMNTRTALATSRDGLDWDDAGLAIDVGSENDYDYQIADHCAIIIEGGETRVYYSGFNGNWRILLANMTAAYAAMDLGLSWTQSTSQDVVGYEVFRESRPRLLSDLPGRAARPTYAAPDGVTPWAFEPASAANVTVYGPAAGPGIFYLPEDSLLNITLCIESDTGEWSVLAQDTDYSADLPSGLVTLAWQPEAGSTIRAWYNCTSARPLFTGGSGFADVRAGAASLASYYYVIRAVDRAGNVAQCPYMVGKVGTDVVGPWGLVGDPFLEGPTPVAEALDGMEWTVARTWDPAQFPHEWTVARRVPTELPDTLLNVTQHVGIWMRVDMPGIFASCGRVSDVSIQLRAGWNLVANPYLEARTVSDALLGIPWDRAEAFSAEEPALITELGGGDLLLPGSGLWVHATSDAVWTADNTP